MTRILGEFCVGSLLLWSLACTPVSAEGLNREPIQIDKGPKDLVHVSAKGVSLPRILRELASSLSASVEQNGLSTELKTLNCEADEPRILLKCLVGGGVSFMIQADRRNCFPGSSAWCGIKVKVWQDEPSQLEKNTYARLGQIAPNIEKMLKSPSADERANGIDAVLANLAIEGPLVMSLLKDLSRDRQSTVRASAIHGLAVFDGAESQALILEATQDSSAEVRLFAMDALGVTGETREIFERGMTDEDPDVRALAGARLESLYTIHPPKEE
jgi:hypothetical protein